MRTGIGADLTVIALSLASIAVVTLLVNKSDGTVSIITAGAQAFNNLLKTVTLQGA